MDGRVGLPGGRLEAVTWWLWFLIVSRSPSLPFHLTLPQRILRVFVWVGGCGCPAAWGTQLRDEGWLLDASFARASNTCSVSCRSCRRERYLSHGPALKKREENTENGCLKNSGSLRWRGNPDKNFNHICITRICSHRALGRTHIQSPRESALETAAAHQVIVQEGALGVLRPPPNPLSESQEAPHHLQKPISKKNLHIRNSRV